jgi:hypothetical protein
MGKASIKISFQDSRRIFLNFLSRFFSYQDPQPFPIRDILVTTMVGMVDRKSPILKRKGNAYFIYFVIEPIERILIVSPFGVNAEIVEDAGDIGVRSYKDPVPISKLTIKIRVQTSKILFLGSIIKGKDNQV